MTDSTRALVREVREALEKATKGPWQRQRGPWKDHITPGGADSGRTICEVSQYALRPDEDAHLIAHAPSWLAALCDALEGKER